MKKIAFLLISVLLLAFLAGCNGEVDNLLWDGKTITLIILDSPEAGYFDSEDPTKDSIELTVPYETWEEWRLDGRTINIYFAEYDQNVWSVIIFNDYIWFGFGTEPGYVVVDSNHLPVHPNDQIENGGTYYLWGTIG